MSFTLEDWPVDLYSQKKMKQHQHQNMQEVCLICNVSIYALHNQLQNFEKS